MFTHLQCASGRLLEVAAAATSCDLLECAFGCSLQQARLCSSCQLCFSSSLLLCENYISLDCVSTAISHGIIGGAKQCAYGDSIAGGHRWQIKQCVVLVIINVTHVAKVFLLLLGCLVNQVCSSNSGNTVCRRPWLLTFCCWEVFFVSQKSWQKVISQVWSPNSWLYHVSWPVYKWLLSLVLCVITTRNKLCSILLALLLRGLEAPLATIGKKPDGVSVLSGFVLLSQVKECLTHTAFLDSFCSNELSCNIWKTPLQRYLAWSWQAHAWFKLHPCFPHVDA